MQALVAKVLTQGPAALTRPAADGELLAPSRSSVRGPVLGAAHRLDAQRVRVYTSAPLSRASMAFEHHQAGVVGQASEYSKALGYCRS